MLPRQADQEAAALVVKQLEEALAAARIDPQSGCLLVTWNREGRHLTFSGDRIEVAGWASTLAHVAITDMRSREVSS